MPDLISEKKNLSKSRWLLMSAIIFFILLAVGYGALIIFDSAFKKKIYPNIFVGRLNLGGKTAEQAKMILNQEVDKINQRGIVFSYKNYRTIISPVTSSSDGDLAYQIIEFGPDQTVDRAYNYGRTGNFIKKLENKSSGLTKKVRFSLDVRVNRKEIIKRLQEKFSNTYKPAKDASLVIKKNSDRDYEFLLIKEKYGKAIDYEEAIGFLLINLAELNPQEIKLSTITQYPKIFSRDGLNVESRARQILNAAPLALIYGDNKWVIDEARLSKMLILKANDSAGEKVIVGLDDNELKLYLSEAISPIINKKPIEAKFEINEGRVTEFQNNQDGLALDLEESLVIIKNELAKRQASGKNPDEPIELMVKKDPAIITADNINNFGIKEIIGTGISSFAGSPVNRRHNIKVGSDSLNGLLIKPGEEFSLLKALGKVDGSTGYLPELVIKGNKTTPEFGGGLCQVGTTMFRATLASGLPITQRRNHSYRVTYYEPAGTDATIYNPWPDFRFINDAPYHILIQTKISGDDLIYEFWGTRDGRIIEKTQPTIYNIVKPLPTKYIETVSLKPGEKKCTERAHNGADAYFDYKVTYADSSIKEKRFSSHYVPWQEVCLLGVEKLSASPDGSATSAPETAATELQTN